MPFHLFAYAMNCYFVTFASFKAKIDSRAKALLSRFHDSATMFRVMTWIFHTTAH